MQLHRGGAGINPNVKQTYHVDKSLRFCQEIEDTTPLQFEKICHCQRQGIYINTHTHNTF